MSEADRIESATLPVLQVRCPSWREFAESFVDDLVSGGMYVPNADPLPPLEAVVVKLLLPEAMEIVLSARVVQVVGAAQAEQLGKAPGLALELLNLDAERKRQVVQLIEFARWQGASNDPNTSFARTMLELTPSLPPRELALRLSQLPPAARADSRPAMPAAQPARRDSQTSLPAQRASSRPTVTPGSYTQEQVQRQSSVPAAPSGKSTQAMPAVQARPRSPSTQAMPAVQARPRSPSAQALPAVPPPRRDSQTLPTPPRDAHARKQSGQNPAPQLDAHMRRQSGQILAPREADMAAPSQPAPDATATPSGLAPAGVAPAKPTDQQKLKLVLTNVAHKHYDAALSVTREMLVDNPGDPQALRWQAMCNARLALQRGETQLARDHYEQLLQLDPNHREAREFIRVHDRDKKLNSLPFGRYFTKKK